MDENPKPGRTLIVGSYVVEGRPDRRKEFPDSIGLDMRPGPGVDVVHDLEHPADQLGKFDHIECNSVLEHVRRPWLMAENIERMLVKDGTLSVSVPFIWRVHAYPDDYWRMTINAVRSIFPRIEWTTLCYSTNKGGKTDNAKMIPHHRIELQHYFARTMVIGFGRRRP